MTSSNHYTHGTCRAVPRHKLNNIHFFTSLSCYSCATHSVIQTKNGYARQVMTLKCIHYLSADEQFLFLFFVCVYVIFRRDMMEKKHHCRELDNNKRRHRCCNHNRRQGFCAPIRVEESECYLSKSKSIKKMICCLFVCSFFFFFFSQPISI